MNTTEKTGFGKLPKISGNYPKEKVEGVVSIKA